jgi:hypothetical protein
MFEEEFKKNLAIDFDGVIHKNSLGFYDGTIYDEPVQGALDAVRLLSEKFHIIIFTAKAKEDRPLVNGKTGSTLVWQWLSKHGISQYVKEVTAEKPRAVAYIDDKAIHFTNWYEVLHEKSLCNDTIEGE